MLTILSYLLIALAAGGLLAAIRGFRGRYVDQHPYCRKCGYNLEGRTPDRVICTECGSGLLRPGAIRIGRRERQLSHVLAGLVIVLLSVTARQYVQAVQTEWELRPIQLQRAIQAGNLAEINRLLTLDPGLVGSQHGDWHVGNLLEMAVYSGKLPVLQRLVDGGARLTGRCHFEGTVLHVAASRKNAAMVRFLLGKGMDPNARNIAGQTPMHLALEMPYLEKEPEVVLIIDALADAGADLLARNTCGWTPLHQAATWMYTGPAAKLLARGAAPTAIDNDGRTPLNLAIEYHHREVADLIQAGASPATRPAEPLLNRKRAH